MLGAAAFAAQAQSSFPFDRDLVLDARPMRGSKRVPILEISANGRAQIDLWCKRGQGQATITGSEMTLTLGQMNDEPCSPERAQADEDMIAALGQVTGWSVSGNTVTLTGATTLRFRAATN
jgi:heat shock protein HslJ